MKKLFISTMIHPQSGKKVECIIILGEKFIYSDKRGYGNNANISSDFANKIISNFPVKMDTEGYPIYFPERLRNDVLKLTWNLYTNGFYDLKIHSGSSHVWSSDFIRADFKKGINGIFC